MSPRPNRNWIEWAFVIFLVALCSLLTVLQYRWTGEIARAETARLRGNLGEQCRQLCSAFDLELAESCARLRPARGEGGDSGREAAYSQRLRDWLAGEPRPIFRRVVVAITSEKGVQLSAVERERLAPLEPPAEWGALMAHLKGNRGPGPGSPPFSNPSGMLIEFPTDGGGRRGGPQLNGRMIFELDADYLRQIWLPELIRAYLSPSGHIANEVEIRTVMPPATTIYSSRTGASDGGETPISTFLNRQGHRPDSREGAGAEGRWVLEARYRPGALEAVVAASRRRNLGVAVALNFLILAAGIALVRHTRRSRRLAEQQMHFVAAVSHELRTPLTVIRGAAHLQRGLLHDPAQIDEYACLITQHAEDLSEMVEQVLEFSAEKKSRAAARYGPVGLDEVLRDAIAATTAEAQAAHCQVALTLAPSLPAVLGDAVALRRVFQNLIGNAAKHGGEGGWIGVTAATPGSDPPTIEVQVADFGPGIPERELGDVFEPFFRGAAARAAQVRGSGLGLSLVREIVEAHGGTISVRSVNGHGATFTVRLPAATGGTESASAHVETRGVEPPAS